MKIKVKTSGDFKNLYKSLAYYKSVTPIMTMEKIGTMTVEELKAKSPVKTGQFRDGWGQEVGYEGKNIVLTIYNTSHKDTPDLPWWLEYGHSAKGVWIEGRNFIKPTIEEMNKRIDELLEVTLRG